MAVGVGCWIYTATCIVDGLALDGFRCLASAAVAEFCQRGIADIALEVGGQEASRLEAINLHASSHLHVMAFGSRLRELLRQPWDMVHIYQEPYILAGWQSAYWTPKQTPFVFFSNQNITKQYPPPFSWMEQYCLDRCAGWIGCGETVINALLKKGYGRRPHRLIGYGVDVDAFRPDPERRRHTRELLGWDDSVPVISFVGRLVPEKGLTMLTAVLDGLRSPWRALFIGSGPMQVGLESGERNIREA